MTREATPEVPCCLSYLDVHAGSYSNSSNVSRERKKWEHQRQNEVKPHLKGRATHYFDEQKEENTSRTDSDGYWKETTMFRVLILMLACLAVHCRAHVQVYIDIVWNYLRQQPFFYSAYFESVYVTVVYGLIIALYPYAMHYISFLSKFKVQQDVTYVHQTVAGMLKDAVVYLAPLFFADAVIQKKYSGVSEEEWAEHGKQWIQTTRALPASPPPFLTLCAHVAGSVVVFDALFFLVHLSLHKNAFLYRHVHALHHRHGAMHPHVTNQLTVTERAAIVVAANYSLKLFRAHPLARLVFVLVFLWLLVDNHTGYDLPWSPHRLMPRGIMGGPARHHAHHVHGARHYQPFFTYLDACLESWSHQEFSTPEETGVTYNCHGGDAGLIHTSL